MPDNHGRLPLHQAITYRNVTKLGAVAEIVQLLLAAAPGAALLADGGGCLALHCAAVHSRDADADVGQLLGVAPQAAMAAAGNGPLPLHFARSGAAAQLLLAAAPATAMVRDA